MGCRPLGNGMGPRFSGALELFQMYVNLETDYRISASIGSVSPFSDTGLTEFTKIYCSCGRFVDIDSQTYRRRTMMQKPIECTYCRNSRIAAEIESLDEHYGVIEGEAVF